MDTDKPQKYGRLTASEASNRGYLPGTVLLNGEPIRDCAVFDDVEGWADVFVKDENGQYKLNEYKEAETKRLYGTIEYVPFKGNPPQS